MTSSCLCKNAEGAVFPFQVEPLEDGVDDAVHRLHIDEADHGPGSAPDFDEAALDDVGGAQFAPQMPGEREEGKQLGQVALQLFDHGGIFASPASAEGAGSSHGLAASVGQVNGLRISLDRIVVAPADLLQMLRILCTQQR